MSEIPEDVMRMATAIANERFALGLKADDVQALAETIASAILAEREQNANLGAELAQAVRERDEALAQARKDRVAWREWRKLYMEMTVPGPMSLVVRSKEAYEAWMANDGENEAVPFDQTAAGLRDLRAACDSPSGEWVDVVVGRGHAD